MDKHEFSKMIYDGIKKRKAEEAKRKQSDYMNYVSNRATKVAREHNRLSKQ